MKPTQQAPQQPTKPEVKPEVEAKRELPPAVPQPAEFSSISASITVTGEGNVAKTRSASVEAKGKLTHLEHFLVTNKLMRALEAKNVAEALKSSLDPEIFAKLGEVKVSQ